MAQITLVWTALPNGYAGNRPRLGVYVQPRLVGSPAENRLSSYTAFTSAASPWTQRVRQIPFTVWLDGQVLPAEAQFAPGLSDDLFRTLFPQDLPVRTFAIDDLRGHTVVTYPTGPVMDFLEQQYAARAAEPPPVTTFETAVVPDKGSGVTLPQVLPELAAIADPRSVLNIDWALSSQFTARSIASPTAGAPPTGNPATRTAAGARAFTVADLDAVASTAGVSREAVAFRMVERYYTPTASATARRRAGFPMPDPEVDVHTVHGGLGDTPVLLRNCGFAFDLLLPPGSLAATGTVRILPGAGAPGTQACPPMRYVSTAARFRPAPRTGSTVVTASGMLPLGGPGGSGGGGGNSSPVNAPVGAPVGAPAGSPVTTGAGTIGNGAGVPVSVVAVVAAGANAGIALVGPAYRVVQGDPDGTALKAATSVRDRAGQGPTTDDESLFETGLLASQRSAGIGVYRADRGAHLAVAVQRTADFDAAVRQGLWAPTPPAPGPQAWPLYADDVVAGYAVDVLDETAPGEWRSLCRRVGRYVPEGPQAPAAFTATDEGVVAVSAVAISSPTDAETQMQAHDALFQWDGWSLAAPRPGLVLVPDDSHSPSPTIGRVHETPAPAGRYERLALPERKAVTHVHLRTEFVAEPGTLPRLRFGRRYRLRARVVDVAGNVAVADDAHASPFVAYGRMEPLEPPTVALRRPLAEGESAERLVIRSDPGDSYTGANTYASDPAQYAIRADVAAATASAPYQSYTPTCERHLVPPATSPEMVERHGRFDTGPWADAGRRESLLHVLAKASGTLLDASVVDVTTGAKTVPQPGFRFVTSSGAPPPDLSARVPGDPLPQGVYAVYDTDEVVVPYLPDPLARGVTFQHVPGAAGALLVPFGNTFPEAHAVRIRLSGAPPGKVRAPGLGAPGPLADAPVFTRRPVHRTLAERQAPAVLTGPRVLDVSLPPAGVVEVLYSTAPKTPGAADSASTVRSDLPEAHDLFGTRRQAATIRTTAAARADLDRVVAGGLHEVVSPVRRLTLVHAVQRPLLVARFDTLTAVRPLGPGKPPSPTSVDLTAQIAFHLASTGRLDLEATWPEPADDIAAPAPRDGRDLREVDTRRGHVAQLNTEPFSASRLPPGATPLTPQGVARYGIYEGFGSVHHEFGDTKRRTVSYRADATTRFRDYFPGEITQIPANLLRTGPVTTVTIPSSARPAAPDVRYVVPTFRWQTEPLQNGLLRRRCGGGLRIWLGRPWYSSGEGEQLGVLVGQGFDNTVSAATGNSFDQYRSRWGLDPFWGGTSLGELGAEAFLTRTSVRDNLSIPNAAGVRMFAAAHDVHFDADRQLWYCDVELDTATAYMPFVKLIVARFQPESIPEMHLSEAVVTDFVQTMPTRTAAVQRLPDGNLTVSIGGPMGNTTQRFRQGGPPPNPSNIRGSLFTAALERQSTAGGAWMAVPDAAATLDLVDDHGLADGLVRGRLLVPEALRAAGTRLRVSVAEFDVHAADAAEGTGVVPGQRLVYADTLDLP